ncbi:MAG: TetR/AcrR family transcriptional regulator [Austwickia sp.]|jgi:AcrR family transcriptional regulator|nr:TetR/AcrR family transcriptional regulator [Austwickia sp.]MBK8437420.1 TetR/AcrR family transcriptional regulator [Austwickia sp.]
MTSRRGRPASGESVADGRTRLLDACWQILLEGRTATVATVCGEAGCTPPTLYHHFGDVVGLHRAACQRAFAQWSQELEHRIGESADPAERVRRRGRAYVEWGVAHPAAYRVLFIDARGPGTGDRPGSGFTQLLEDLAELRATTMEDPALLVEAFAHWSAVHGLTCLALDRPELPASLRAATLTRLMDALEFGGHLDQASA